MIYLHSDMVCGPLVLIVILSSIISQHSSILLSRYGFYNKNIPFVKWAAEDKNCAIY